MNDTCTKITDWIYDFTDRLNGGVVDEDKISLFLDTLTSNNNQALTAEERKEIIREVHSRCAIRMTSGACLKENNHKPWYADALENLIDEQKYWNRYVQYLKKEKHFSSNVVSAIDKSTFDIMDLLGNPLSSHPFSRRGLVIGDIQSGKTSNYTALMNKAADAGYRIMILLAGTIEKLRAQTQERLDSGFMGWDSGKPNNNRTSIGVGLFDHSVSPLAITTIFTDFKSTINVSGKIANLNVPVLFVVKKNKSVLEKLDTWLEKYNTDKSGKINAPMLMIDDEADNASVNTRSDDDPTAINACIRKLLSVFTRSSYVAFTATPYANIFINPDSYDQMLSDDLFPRDFIYALDSPSNYIGARSVFSDEGKYHYMIKKIEDFESYLPEKHKKGQDVGDDLPHSLQEAIASFFIANAIRDLRGDLNSHRSMLINVSRFIAVQERLRNVVEDFVLGLKHEIMGFCLMGEMALRHHEIAFLKSVYEKHFKTLSSEILDGEKMFSWNEIQKALPAAIESIVVRTVNGKNASNALTYDDHKEYGLRIIAIGGFSLSRGLTLEGLSTSYFYRNSKMYDTLMQMGRWFGYRPHYSDLCQIWMNQTSEEWYKYISEATDTLLTDVHRMSLLGKTPKEFGLGVRQDNNSLLITALNKMKYAKDYRQTVNLSGAFLETYNIYKTYKENNYNIKVVDEWLRYLNEAGYRPIEDNGSLSMAVNYPQILSVPKKYIIQLLKKFNSHPNNFSFSTSDLVPMLRENSDETIDTWDIVIPTGAGSIVNFGGLVDFHSPKRKFILHGNSIQLSGRNGRIAGPDMGKAGLTKAESDKIKKIVMDSKLAAGNPTKSMSMVDYFTSGESRHALLLIYLLELNIADDDPSSPEFSEKQKICDDLSSQVIALGVGIPSVKGKQKIVYEYKVNLIKYRELLGIGEDDDYEEDTGLEE